MDLRIYGFKDSIGLGLRSEGNLRATEIVTEDYGHGCKDRIIGFYVWVFDHERGSYSVVPGNIFCCALI